jgi:hypothetical protein
MFNRRLSSYLVASSLFAVALITAVASSPIQAPAEAVPKAQAASAPPRLNRPLPFGPGEVLTYNIAFSKLIFSGSIGQLKLTVKNGQQPARNDSRPASDPSKGTRKPESETSKESSAAPAQVSRRATSVATAPSTIEFGAEVVSKGFFTWLFGIKIEDSYGAVVSSDDFGLSRCWKDIDQGDLHRRYETRVDREGGTVSYSESDRKNPQSPKIKTGNCPRWVLDLLSAVYFIRTQELKEGSQISIPLTDVGQTYVIDVVPVKHEDVEVEAGRFKTLQLDLKIFDGKYIRRSGQLLVWLSDDARQLPVRARVKSSGATVNITLAHYERLG